MKREKGRFGRRMKKSRYDSSGGSGVKNPCYVCSTDDVRPGESRGFVLKAPDGELLEIALFNVDGRFYATSDRCVHKGGPLSKGTLNGNIVTCPWHGWKYSVLDGKSPHEGGDSVDSFETTIVNKKVFVNPAPASRGARISKPHQRYAELESSAREHLRRADISNNKKAPANRSIRVLGISTTSSNDKVAPRTSTSERALTHALSYSKTELGAETIMVKLRDLYFKDCEGYYSKDARACIFPCSISEMDKDDRMIEIYEKMILWADVVVVATPIRWGSASSLYYKMVQRLNCVQNQIITHDNYLIRDKVAAFIITGGQDNVQHVAGEMMTFWSQLGFVLAKFPFVGWSRGWYAEDTENNYDSMNNAERFNKDVMRSVRAAVRMSRLLKESRYDEQLLDKAS